MKTIAAAIILFASVQFTYSQFVSGLGIKGGLTFSSQDYKFYSGQQFFETQNTLGLNAAMFIEFASSKYFSVLLEPGYERRGYQTEIIRTDEFGNPIGTDKLYERTHYFTTGLLGKAKIPGKPITAYVTAGPRLDIYFGYDMKVPDGWLIAGEQEPEDYVLEHFKKVNYSFTVGAGLELSTVERFRPFVEFNYSPQVAESYGSANIQVKEHYFNIKAGMYFLNFEKQKKRK